MKCVEVVTLHNQFVSRNPERVMIYYLYEHGLSMDQAAALVRKFSGAGNKELAMERGTEEQTAANLLFRARRKLKAIPMRYCNHCYHAPECASYLKGFKEQATVCDTFQPLIVAGGGV